MSMNESQEDLFASDPSIPLPHTTASFAGKRPLRILVADDNAINRNVVQTILDRLGYQPIEASGGEKAMGLLKKEPFDILFTDIDMPEMDGVELAQALRELEKSTTMGSKKTEIIAITANVSPETKLRCKRAGMDGFLEKPIDQDRIKNQLLKSWRRIKNRRSRS